MLNFISHLPLKRISLSGLFLCLIFIATSAATLDETAFRILRESPEFKSQTYNLESAAAALRTESNLPDPELGGEYLVMPKDVDNRWALELSWGVEWPGVYRARGKEANLKLQATQQTIWVNRAERLAEIKDLLLDYIRSTQKILILEELTQNNDTIYHLAEESAKNGELTVLDLNKIKLEYANIRVAKATLMDEQAEIIANLSAIIGRNCTDILNTLDLRFPDLVLPTEAEIEMIKSSAPSVKAALSEAETARVGKKVASMEALPSLSLGYKHAYEDQMHFNGATFGVSIPIFSSRGKQKAAKAAILEAEYNAEATAMEVEAEAKAALRRLKLIHSQIEEIAPLVEDANYNATLLKAYKKEVLTLIEYISDRNYFTNAAVELVGLRHNAAKAYAFLQRYLTPLPE